MEMVLEWKGFTTLSGNHSSRVDHHVNIRVLIKVGISG